MDSARTDDGRTVTFLSQTELDNANVAIVDAEVAVSKLNQGLTPNPAEIKVQFEAALKDVTAKAGPDVTKGQLQAQTQMAVESKLAVLVLARQDAAKRATAHAKAVTEKNAAALEQIPSFLPPWERTQSGTEHELKALRAEMKLDRLRADWRERPLPAMLDAFQAAHTAEDWPLATALQLELERLLALGPSAKGLTEGAEVFAGNTGRIRAALAAAKQRRAAMVEPVTRETVQRHKARVSELEAALQGREGLLYEIKQRGAYPMQGFSSLRR